MNLIKISLLEFFLTHSSSKQLLIQQLNNYKLIHSKCKKEQTLSFSMCALGSWVTASGQCASISLNTTEEVFDPYFFFALLSENALLVSIEEKNKVGGQLLWSGAIIPMSLHQRVLPPSTDRVNAVQHGKVLLMSIQCCMKEMFLVSEELRVWPISMPFY